MNEQVKMGALPASEKKFWKMRSAGYNRLDWVNKEGYLDAFIRHGNFSSKDRVLDIGTGTGVIAKAVAAKGARVTGIDISPDMLAFARKGASAREFYRQADVHKLPFKDGSFSKVTARMVFHHVTQNNRKAIRECFRTLKPGGMMVLSEGVPPTKAIRGWYTRMFKLKEDRITFYQEDLVRLMRIGGFKDIRTHVFMLRRTSIMNWLRGSGIPQERQDRIYQMHLDMPASGKRAYKMKITPDDVFIDMKFIILTGIKK
jgi:ubiquinone/menaquinone biosynthesis C-methylase UbiE